MFSNLLSLLKSFLRFLLLRTLLFSTLFTSLALSTIFVAFFLLDLKWHLSPAYILLISLSPWLIAVIVLAVLTRQAAQEVEYKKTHPVTIDKTSLAYRIGTSAMFYLARRKKSRSVE